MQNASSSIFIIEERPFSTKSFYHLFNRIPIPCPRQVIAIQIVWTRPRKLTISFRIAGVRTSENCSRVLNVFLISGFGSSLKDFGGNFGEKPSNFEGESPKPPERPLVPRRRLQPSVSSSPTHKHNSGSSVTFSKNSVQFEDTRHSSSGDDDGDRGHRQQQERNKLVATKSAPLAPAGGKNSSRGRSVSTAASMSSVAGPGSSANLVGSSSMGLGHSATSQLTLSSGSLASNSQPW